jgi:hypothetical protein
MIDEEREQRLVAAAMYYFGQRDAGMELRLTDLLGALSAELRTDLMHLLAALNHDRAGTPPDTEPWSRPIKVVRQMLQELRGRK